MSHTFAKPENALRKANDLVKVGQDDAALKILHSMLLSRRFRTWQDTHENIMLLYIKLASDNRKNAKDGLLQYRNICQSIQVNSLEKIIAKYCEYAEAKVTQAQEEVKQTDTGGGDITESSAQAQSIVSDEVFDEDLGFAMSQQHYFVHGVGGQDEADRSTRKTVAPWLRYLWDTYRTSLEVMRNNSKLLTLYHDIVHKALQYCVQQKRTSEFRRLCEIQRTHISAIHSHQSQTNAIDMLSPEVIQVFLGTRFQQLETAALLDLWQEAYRIIEDIDELMSSADVELDKSLLSIYYEKLNLIFWKSGNFLFHAYCIEKLFSLAQTTQTASLSDRLMLAALIIPAAPSNNRILFLDNVDQKNMRLATMLGFEGLPSRARLLSHITKMNVINHVSPDIKKIHDVFAADFAPRKLSQEMLPLINKIQSNEHLNQYVPGLIDALVLNLLHQLALVYRVMRVEAFMVLLPRDVKFSHVEAIIALHGTSQKLSVRIDHAERHLLFSTNELNHSVVRDQLSRLSRNFQSISEKVRESIEPGSLAARAQQRKHVFDLVRAAMNVDHRDVFVRKQVIEKRKQKQEMALTREKELECSRQAALRAKRAEEERLRLIEEGVRREKDRIDRIDRATEIEANKLLMAQLQEKKEAASNKSKKIIKELESNLENVNRQKLLDAAAELTAQAAQQKEQKQKDEIKRFTFQIRAERLEERELIIKEHQQQRIVDVAYYEEQWQKYLEKHRQHHEFQLEEKVRLRKLVPQADIFISKIMEQRNADFCIVQAEQNKRFKILEAKRAEEQSRIEAEEAERERLRLKEIEREQEEREAELNREKREAEERERVAALARQSEIQRRRDEEIEQRKRNAAIRPTSRIAVASTPLERNIVRRNEQSSIQNNMELAPRKIIGNSTTSSWRDRFPASDTATAQSSSNSMSGGSSGRINGRSNIVGGRTQTMRDGGGRAAVLRSNVNGNDDGKQITRTADDAKVMPKTIRRS